ncbi:DUF551 domain-containing protein [Citrobacter sp. Cs237]|uniref:DUF551 domain-containing protein n=1 Tax=Citrobacter sp. Cs237 TaxID=2985156 RepID=UPI002577BB1B|nr:DUF551 domain-containing protein [Citrobacter sp. Cs237]MDM2751480.1 DUF551 domain-containing protein [Citrobacter sp. Cs237]
MTTITREQAHKIIDAADEVITALAGTNDDVHPDNSRKMCDLLDDLNDRYAPPEVVRDLARIALASLEAEPVAYIFKHPAGRLFWSLIDERNKGQSDVMPVYSAPVPAFVPPVIEPDYEVINGILPTANPDEYSCCIAADMWNACRAAMLQGSQPVTTSKKLPFEQWLSQQTGTIDVECGCVMTEVFFHWLRVAYEAVNSSASADIWIPVSERLPDFCGRYWCYVEEQNDLGKSHYQWNCSWNGERWLVDSDNGGRVTHWMPLPAAPQQEVNP